MTEVRGWAYHDQEELAAVMVSVDGTVVAAADLVAAPPDLVAVRPETRNSSRCGWRATLDLHGAADRRVRLGGLAVFASGLVRELSPLDVVVARSPMGEITRPRPGSIVGPGPVQVTGWADAPLGLARVEIQVNGRDAGPARPIIPVARDHPATDRSVAETTGLRGFEHVIRGAGPALRIEAEIVDRAGCRFPIPGADVTVVEPEASEPPTGGERLDVLAARVRAVRSEMRLDGPPIRLVAFTHRLDLGGGQLYLTELLRQLLNWPDTSCLVISASDGPLRDELEAQGASVHITDFPFSSPDAYEGRLLELAHLVAANDCNVSIVNTAVAGIGADLANRLGIPGIWAIHESVAPDEHWLMPYYVAELSPYVSDCLRHALAESAVVVFEAEATRQLYLPKASQPERFLLVPYGVPIAVIDEYRRITARAEAHLREAGRVGVVEYDHLLLQGLRQRSLGRVADPGGVDVGRRPSHPVDDHTGEVDADGDGCFGRQGGGLSDPPDKAGNRGDDRLRRGRLRRRDPQALADQLTRVEVNCPCLDATAPDVDPDRETSFVHDRRSSATRLSPLSVPHCSLACGIGPACTLCR